ncbi:unnamed protein product [Brassica oleracea]
MITQTLRSLVISQFLIFFFFFVSHVVSRVRQNKRFFTWHEILQSFFFLISTNLFQICVMFRGSGHSKFRKYSGLNLVYNSLNLCLILCFLSQTNNGR